MRTPPEAINNNGGSGNSCSPSKSSSRSSSLSSFSPSSPVIPTPSARKFMEEVWKDISLASLRDHSNNSLSSSTTTNYHPAGFCGTILQDFLPRSSNKVLPTVETATFLASLAPPPATKSSLNSISGFDFAFLESRSPARPNLQLPCHASVTAPPNSFVSSVNYSPVGVLGSSSVLFPSYCKKRVQEYGDEPSDRRYKRMIKNRESAARSRAKKQEPRMLFHAVLNLLQAYRDDLELELAHLQEENARLRRQQEEFCLVAAAHLPRKRRIHRTLTAPF